MSPRRVPLSGQLKEGGPYIWNAQKGNAHKEKNRMGVADGTRTRNNQNHNLGLYH